MLTVACVFKKSKTYKRLYVERLERMVAQHLSQPYRFVCVDDSPFPGWWAKISLFNRFSGRVLYLDLDSTVIGSLDALANHPAPFVIVKNFKEIREDPKAKFNSSVMAFDADAARHLFTEFSPAVMDRLNGDQDWISERLPNAETFPADWCVSYKVRRYLKLKTLPQDARVICYHGKPKPWELPVDDINGFTIAQ